MKVGWAPVHPRAYRQGAGVGRTVERFPDRLGVSSRGPGEWQACSGGGPWLVLAMGKEGHEGMT